jgi:hypothetical protein
MNFNTYSEVQKLQAADGEKRYLLFVIRDP